MPSKNGPDRRRTVASHRAGVAALAVFVLPLTGCGSLLGEDSAGSGGGDDGPITLTVSTFNDFGYTDELLARYTEENPNVTVEHIVAPTSDEARLQMLKAFTTGDGSELADVVAAEVDWLPELMEHSDLFEDLTDPEVTKRWVDWKVAQATTSDGELLGYGTDIGPEAICYRADLFEQAGLPSDRDAVAELLGGKDATWERYFEVGRQFTAQSDSAWFDGTTGMFQGMVNQLPAAFEDPATQKPTDLSINNDVRAIYDQITDGIDDGLSAGLEQWTPQWTAGFQDNSFATMLCPGWMMGPIESYSEGVQGWDVANVFPGGGGNWGGSFLAVPSAGQHTQEAKKLAAWLTAPEQQTEAFTTAGAFPSQLEAQDSDAVQGYVNPFFNNAPVGKIFTARAQSIDGAPHKGPYYFAIRDEVNNALAAVDAGTNSPEIAWNQAVQTVGGFRIKQ
ncbi:extracellular solute-binding protein [Promicromonospora sukumoe]|uniref:Cellobiose transport system substrate-binding protein n=1 Tax=Promicromonospora sukumoe TaxID=88382 RepID=A0A7W3JC04_9MICO|nr:extracellular solute-binding protein [Promicromonospora sukumoe]MBA8810050.1 cellobiose transport system substrate-binding protein [Promicromonospora sukumoe]